MTDEKKKPKKTSPTVRTLNKLRDGGAHMVAVVEKWKQVPGYDGIYEVSNYGNIRSLDRIDCVNRKLKGKEIKKSIKSNGYLTVGLRRDGTIKYFSVHRIVATVFICEPKKGHQVNHKDGRKTNNIPANLEWVTSLENTRHAIQSGLFPRGETHYKSSLKEKDVREIRKLQRKGHKATYISNEMNLSIPSIEHVLYGDTWRHVE